MQPNNQRKPPRVALIGRGEEQSIVKRPTLEFSAGVMKLREIEQGRQLRLGLAGTEQRRGNDQTGLHKTAA
jgi:hypothetical protein